jgi:hypothetical protein
MQGELYMGKRKFMLNSYSQCRKKRKKEKNKKEIKEEKRKEM